jgi:hypothetical protein
LEAKLEERLKEDANEIRELKATLQRKERSFQDSLESMPTEARTRISNEIGQDAVTNSSNDINKCVVCDDTPSIYAILPCGHFCLCETCSGPCNVCPLCLGVKESVLKIFMGR